MNKKIKIAFLDFWPDFEADNNYFTKILSKHFEIEISDKPDYIFCSEFGNNHSKSKYRNCIKILFTGENLVPDFNCFDYAMGFHYIDFEDRYLRLPLYALYKKTMGIAVNKHMKSTEEFLKKKKFCAYVVSNPDASDERDKIIDSLSVYKELLSGGHYRNNVGGPVKDKMSFLSDFRFTLAVENSGTSGYTTEKILHSFASGTIPIYWGNPRIVEEFNPDSFINVRDFNNYDELRDYVVSIYEDDARYLEIAKTPIFREDSEAKNISCDDYAEEFLVHIFNQEKKDAYRRNMIHIGRRYQDSVNRLNKVKTIMDFFAKPFYYLRKKLKQI